MDPDQTAPIGAVCSGSTLFASILNLSDGTWQLFAADNFSRRHIQMHFFLGALRVKDEDGTWYECHKWFPLKCHIQINGQRENKKKILYDCQCTFEYAYVTGK